MTHKLRQDDPDIVCAKAILDKGWRQGAIFDPRGIVGNIQLTDGEFLVLCTQSCTVVSSRFATDPIVEAMGVKLLPKYNPRAFEATGKNQRKLHIEVIGSSQFKCIECDINRRFFFDRHHLLNINPLQELEIGVEGSTKLAGWLARSYTRIALPNLLVERVKPELLTLILKCLDEKQTNGQNKGSPIHESVSFIYLDWQPRHDVTDLFELKFIFLCSDAQTEEMLENSLLEKLEPYQAQEGKHGVKISSIICRTPNTTFITDLNGYERYSEWDFLSELGEIAQAPPKMMRERR
jgi:hypothetical protein